MRVVPDNDFDPLEAEIEASKAGKSTVTIRWLFFDQVRLGSVLLKGST